MQGERRSQGRYSGSRGVPMRRVVAQLDKMSAD